MQDKVFQRVAGALVFALLLGFNLSAQAPAKRAPVPEEEKRTAALKLVREIFGKKYDAATTPEARSELAAELYRHASETNDDLVAKYVLLRVSRDVAVKGGDVQAAFLAVDALNATYDVDALELKSEIVETLSRDRSGAVSLRALLPHIDSLIEQCIRADEFTKAAAVNKTAITLARRMRDSALIKQFADRADEISSGVKEFRTIERALETLKEKPDDPVANTLVGKYHGLDKGDWETAIPHLAKGAPDDMQAAAKLDLAGGKTADQQTAIGTGWWDLAEKAEGREKQNLLFRAAHWYQQAVPGLKGLTKTKIERRLEEIGPLTTAPDGGLALAPWENLLPLVDLKQHVGGGDWVVQRGALICAKPYRRARISLPRTPTGSYELEVAFTRGQGDDEVAIYLPVGTGGCQFMMGVDNQHSGLSQVDGMRADVDRNPTRKPGSPANGRRYVAAIKVDVQDDGEAEVDVRINGNQFIHWQGKQTSLREDFFWRLGSKSLGLGANNSVVAFHSAKLREAPQPTNDASLGALPGSTPQSDGAWTVLFRSSNPRVWNTDANQDGEYAIRLSNAPQGVQYLRLKRTDNNQQVIMPMNNAGLSAKHEVGNIGFNGSARYAWGARTLGIYHKSQESNRSGEVFPGSPGLGRGYRGWGFGVIHSQPQRGQGYTWGGTAIGQTVFEIAVTSSPLAIEDRRYLLR
jgi:hypothetical protein